MKNSLAMGFLVFFLMSVLFSSCDNGLSDPGSSPPQAEPTARVTFFNMSSHRVVVRRDSFAGVVVAELGSGQPPLTTNLRVSDTVFGTTFAVDYYVQVTDGLDPALGQVMARLRDFEMQIHSVLAEDTPVTIQIPNPANPEFSMSFIRITNLHNMPVTLNHFGAALRQAGTGTFPIAAFSAGIFRIDDIPRNGEREFTGFSLHLALTSEPVPVFTARNGWIYDFELNANGVVKTGSQPLAQF